MTKKMTLIALFLYLAFMTMILFKSSSSLAVYEGLLAENPVEWTPESPDVGDIITITYDPSATSASIDSSASQVYMIWGMYVRGNQNLTGRSFGVVPPSMEMWPTDTVLYDITSDRFVKSPMSNIGGVWSISIELNDRPDYLVLYFEDNDAVRDNNDGNYWLVDSKLKLERLSMVSPTFAEPLIKLNGSEVTVKVDAPIVATNWQIVLENIEFQYNPSLSAVHNTEDDIWEITFSTPSLIGLYDMNVSATVNGNLRYDWEPNSIKLIEEFKSEYKFVILGDPQIHRDGSAGYAYRNEKTGIGNFTDVLLELNLLNPEFILIVGDLTEWTDEIALLNFRKWCNLYLENAPVVLIMGNHGDFEGTASTGNHEWGSGKGTWLNIIGPASGIFYYGNHAVVRGDSHSLSFNDEKDDGIANYEFVMEALDDVASNDMKFLMLHHPLSTYGKPSEEVIQGDAERNSIISKLQSIGATAHFHGHLHADKYDQTGSLHHIGTTEAVGDNPGFRVVNIADNIMINFSYVPVNSTVYYAPSTPIGGLKAYFQTVNDGSQSSQTAAVHNCFNQHFNGAHLRFYMQDGPAYQYSGGILYNSFVQDGVRVVDLIYDIKANSTQILSVHTGTPIEFTDVIPTCPPITVAPPPTTPPPVTTTTTTASTTSGFLLIELIMLFATIPVIQISRNRKR